MTRVKFYPAILSVSVSCPCSLEHRPGDASWLGDPAWSDIQDISAIQQMYDNEIQRRSPHKHITCWCFFLIQYLLFLKRFTYTQVNVVSFFSMGSTLKIPLHIACASLASRHMMGSQWGKNFKTAKSLRFSSCFLCLIRILYVSSCVHPWVLIGPWVHHSPSRWTCFVAVYISMHLD